MTLALLFAAAAVSLSPGSLLVERHSIAGADGRSAARLQHLYLGHRVWGSEAVSLRDSTGEARLVDRGLARDVSVDGEPRLTADDASRIALRHLAARGAVEHTAELIVFPTRFTGGIVTRLDPATGRVVIDFERSLPVRRPGAPYVWAYEVRTVAINPQDGHREERYVVDASTGTILRKWSALKGVGVGKSYFRGNVPLATTQDADGTYRLLAQGRGTTPQPWIASRGGNQIGLQTYSGYFDLAHGFSGQLPYSGHAADTWGDGSHYVIAWDFLFGRITLDFNADHSLGWPKAAFAGSGETTAVDAHYGLTAAWDFLQEIFGRDGIDGLGTSTLAVVHPIRGATPERSVPVNDTAFWSPSLFGLVIGDGTAGVLPGGWIALTGIDIIGHEVAHGIALSEAALIDGALSGALDEANSDIIGKMLQAWVDGGRGSAIAEFDAADRTRWQVGLGGFLDNGFLRAMDRPSDDGFSGDQWYDGLEDLGPHAASGPVDRFFVLLAQGVSTDAASPRYSAYLPGGMPGLGNDRAARIWYKALTEQLFAADDFDAARAATIAAAKDLYGAGATEEQSVMKAWAAVNVGSAPGEATRVRVTFPVTNGPGSFLDHNAFPSGILSRVQFFPTRARVRIRADVANATDKRLTWALATPNEGFEAGHIDADGVWTTPSFNYYGELLTVTARSAVDPRQYAKGHALLVGMDADTDGQTDALDLGAVAMNWGVQQPPNAAVLMTGIGHVSDWDLVFFTEAVANAWPAGTPSP